MKTKMKMNKKDGGIISNWRIHELTYSQEKIDKSFPNEKLTPMVLSGMVVKDPVGRWNPGDTMRSSLIVNINKEKNTVETRNTLYKLQGEGNNEETAFPEMGDAILSVFW